MKSAFDRYDKNTYNRNPAYSLSASASLRQAWMAQSQKPRFEGGEKTKTDNMQQITERNNPVQEDLQNDSDINTKKKESGAYGCVYHKDAQIISVRFPGEVAPIKFDCNACMRQTTHEKGASEVIVSEEGDYEITFELNLTAKAASVVVFELQVNGTALPGGRSCYMLTVGSQAYRGFTIASLSANDSVRLVMTSGVACEATLTCGGAALKILKLGESTA